MKLQSLLKDYDKSAVNVFIAYVDNLKTEVNKDNKLKNWWAKNLPCENFANAFIKVAKEGLYIDGDSITLTWKKKLVITYDYHAYKNKVILNYPESVFDFGLVWEGDEFNFSKESGRVIYMHKMNDPFKLKKKLLGAFGVIKNSKGEFIELLNMDDIEKMKNTSTMKNIWNTWFDRMVLKSVIKRICSVHFHDVTKNIDAIDNETNQPELAGLPDKYQKIIDDASCVNDLESIYREYVQEVQNQEGFVYALALKKEELNND